MLRPACFLAAAVLAGAADFPTATISNGAISVTLMLPDPVRGYYQGTRFDWSGQISSLEFHHHQFVGQWFEHYDPKLHDAILGPVEEFRTNGAGLGYAEAKPGGSFIRIGVGVVRKPDEPEYQLFHTYDITDPGRWSIRKGRNWVEFTHRLSDANGYAYEYVKTVRLVKGRPQMLIEHVLRNKGGKTIETAVYDHNFYVIDHQTTGPNVVVRFPFAPKATKDLNGLAVLKGNDLVYTKELETGQSVFTEIEGFGTNANDYDFRIENRKSGAGVRIRGDRPLAKVVFWSIRTVACPEPYIEMQIEPGQESKWNYTYDFYVLPNGR
jgi:hypothetical protein